MPFLFFLAKVAVLVGTVFILGNKQFKSALIMLIGQVIVVSIGFLYLIIPYFSESLNFDISILYKLLGSIDSIGTLIFAAGFILMALRIKETKEVE